MNNLLIKLCVRLSELGSEWHDLDGSHECKFRLGPFAGTSESYRDAVDHYAFTVGPITIWEFYDI